MWMLVAFLLLAEAPPSEAIPRNLPDESDAVDAYFEQEVAICSALIDVCDYAILPLPRDSIRNLTCQSSQKGRAKCTFRTLGSKCSAYFVSKAREADHARSVRRSHLGPEANNDWAVSWTDRIGKGPEVKCKTVG